MATAVIPMTSQRKGLSGIRLMTMAPMTAPIRTAGITNALINAVCAVILPQKKICSGSLIRLMIAKNQAEVPMKRWSWLLLAALAVAPAIADDKKKKDDKKAKDAPVVQAPAVQDAVKDAEAKLAAGDADGAIAALEKAMGADPKAALRLVTQTGAQVLHTAA